ncbi:hypothetical protein [Streptomyces albus]|uniref:hypothetical protein n=1 Tax=Streptomyces albus TaxID=1888 RepID=UPI00099E324C|nr:hypothetical protein [Streptomyces albus]
MAGRRRAVAAAGAVVLVLEAALLVGLNLFLGKVADAQQMSLAGIDPHAMTVSAVIGAVLVGGYVLACALVLLRTAVRDVAPHGFLRVLLISCAVVHGVLGAFCVGLLGWTAFAAMMVVLGLIVWSLTWYGTGEPRPAEEGRGPAEPGPPPAGAPPAPEGFSPPPTTR